MSLIESFGWKKNWEKIILSITANTQLAAIFKTAPKALISAFRCVWSEKDLHSAGRGASRSKTAYPCKKEASTVENFKALASGEARQGKGWWKAARGKQPHRVAWPNGLRQGSSIGGPRATSGPRERNVWPALISNNGEFKFKRSIRKRH